jgi:putrescine aminotransferase
VRGLGLMIGVEFTSDSLAGEFLMELMQHKVVANLPASYPRVIRFTPSAFLETGDVDWLVTAVAESARALGERYPAQTPLMATA